jgi:hypothetical protein
MNNMKKQKQKRKFEDLSLLEYIILELVLGLIDLGIFIAIIKAGII